MKIKTIIIVKIIKNLVDEKNNNFFKVINELKQEENNMKDSINFSINDVALNKVINNNFFKEKQTIENNISNQVDKYGNQPNNKKEKTLNVFNDSIKIKKKAKGHKLRKYNKEEKKNQIELGAKKNIISNQNYASISMNIGNFIDNITNLSHIFKMGYCDFIKGYICKLKMFKKNNNSEKYRKYLKFKKNLFALIDFSSFIKMIILLSIDNDLSNK